MPSMKCRLSYYELTVARKVDPNDDFPKTSCLDCANNVKIAVRTKKRIICSHKTLLEEFLAKCKEINDYIPSTTSNSKDVEEDISAIKDSNSCSLSKLDATHNDIKLGNANANVKESIVSELPSGTVTRSHSKCSKISECNNDSCKENPRDIKSVICLNKGENTMKLSTFKSETVLDNTDNNEDFATKKEDYSEDEALPSPMSDAASDVDWTPCKIEDQKSSKEFKKSEKTSVKPIVKGSDGVFFVKKRSTSNSRKKRTAETVIRIKKKPKGRTPPTRVTCEICKKEVQSYWLQKHMETHEYNPVTCEFCGLISKSATALRHHVFYYHRSAADEYMCDQCGKSFRSKYRLNLHKKKEHGGTKDFECTTCGKKFFERMHLKRHVDKTHKNIRPYVCDFCGKSFKSRNHIKIHERIHSKEAPYTCHMCGESFKMKLTLRTHLKGIHNVQEVQKVFCDICKRGFASDIALKAHVNSRIHETEKCQYCSEMFTREYMVNHLKDVHGAPTPSMN